MDREEELRQIATEALSTFRPQCLAFSLLLFDRAEDGSFKPEHLENFKTVMDDDDYAENDESSLLALLAARLGMVASMCDEEGEMYGLDPALVLGIWAGFLMEARQAIRENEARNN